jgi:alkanesulfonate monooxygenase SsuD/methylene tetrahydromethanopterin reductase-like flavin-dependent oxidoreductase (luciferase family)
VNWIRLEDTQSISFVGSPTTVASGLRTFIDRLAPDELIVVSHIYDPGARLRSYEIVAGIAAELRAAGVQSGRT